MGWLRGPSSSSYQCPPPHQVPAHLWPTARVLLLPPAIAIVLVTCSGPGVLGNAEKNRTHPQTQGAVAEEHALESAERAWI